MSKAFINRTQQQNAESNQTETSQKKIDPVAQLKWLNNQQVDQGWGVPAQMFANEEVEEQVQRKAEGKELQINSNTALEKEADVMGAKAAQGKMADVTGKGIGVQRKTNTFTVPKGWGLAKIADHLGVSIQELKDLNKDKLKNWNGVEGFNAGEKLILPSKAINIAVSDDLYKQYSEGQMDMIELAKATIPLCSKDPVQVLKIFKKLPLLHRDNLAYAISSNSENSVLSSFDKGLLTYIASQLDLEKTSPANWYKYGVQGYRIGKALLGFNDTVEKDDKNSDKKKTPEKLSKEKTISVDDWLNIAKKEMGQTEIKGKKHNKRIVNYHDTTGKFGNDETAWCSSFVNWVMTKAGYEGTNSAWAKGWSKWGRKISKPAYGSIAVIDWSKVGKKGGHVGFVVGKTSSGSMVLLGGNQGDQVKLSAFKTSSIIAYVIPEIFEEKNMSFNLKTIDNLANENYQQTR